MRARLSLGQRTGLALSPAMHLSLSILRMSPAELDEAIATEAAQNPFLLVLRKEPPRRAPGGSGAALEAVSAAAAPSLREGLLRQLAAAPMDEGLRALAALVVAELDPDGFLPVDLDDLAGELDLPLPRLEAALGVVQALEPVGVGARSVAECLTLQLVERGLSRSEAEATLAHLPRIAAREWGTVQRALGLSRAALRARAALLDGLRLRPHDPPDEAEGRPLDPDLRIEGNAAGGHSLRLVAAPGSHVRLDHALMKDAGFAPELAARAQALVDAVAMRGRTLERIGEWVMLRQQAFLQDGARALVPATRAQAAADLGLHPSTVGRAISGKAVDVGGRVWPLSMFFSPGTGSAPGLSARAIGQRIAEMVAAEVPGRPVSDTALTEALHREGVDIARRTVAKYRQGLRIPPAPTRRRLALARRDAGRG